VLQACTEVEQVDMVPEQAACMVAEPAGVSVVCAAVVAMAAHAESPLEKSARLVGLVAVVEELVQVLCLTLDLVGDSTHKRRHTSMSALEVILARFDQGEISLASSPVAVC